MASALAKIDSVDIDAGSPATPGIPATPGLGLNMTMFVAYSGPDVLGGTGAIGYVRVQLLASDNAAAIRGKMGAAVRTAALLLGWTIPTAGCILPTFSID